MKKGHMVVVVAMAVVVVLILALVVGLVVKDSQRTRVENQRSKGVRRKTPKTIEEMESTDQ